MKRTVETLDVRGRRILCRVDFNVPVKDGRVTNDARIRAALPTLTRLLDGGAKRLVLCSHLGRPKGPDPRYSLAPVAERLSALLGRPVAFVAKFPPGEGDLPAGGVVLVENTRFDRGEEKNDEGLSRRLAALGDVFVNDAFGSCHRAHASTEGVTRFLRPAVAGYLVEKEIAFLGRALGDPRRPYVVCLGGAKVSDKLGVIENLLPRADAILVGGGMAFTFLKAKGLGIGRSLCEEDLVGTARGLLASADGRKIRLPDDVVLETGPTVSAHAIPVDGRGLDIGPRTVAAFAAEIGRAATVFWNGPMGVFETKPFDAGTVAVARAVAAATDRGATTVVGGGDSVAALAAAGLEGRISHVSTGGGASMEFVEGKVLPGIACLDEA